MMSPSNQSILIIITRSMGSRRSNRRLIWRDIRLGNVHWWFLFARILHLRLRILPTIHISHAPNINPRVCSGQKIPNARKTTNEATQYLNSPLEASTILSINLNANNSRLLFLAGLWHNRNYSMPLQKLECCYCYCTLVLKQYCTKSSTKSRFLSLVFNKTTID